MTDARLVRPLWRGRSNVDAYTIACVEHAEQIGGHEHIVTQGSYQIENPAREPASGTTHLLGGAIDLAWCGHDRCVLALRQAGGFFWHRTPEQGAWPHHIHGGPRLHPFQDDALHRQELSYVAGGNGLGGVDDGPRLNPIPDPVWPWPEEALMVTPEDEQKIAALIKAAVPDIAEAVWAYLIRNDPEQTARAGLRKAANG